MSEHAKIHIRKSATLYKGTMGGAAFFLSTISVSSLKMLSRVALSVLALSASIPLTNALSHKRLDYLATCQEIEQAVSSETKVSYAGTSSCA